ncbi:hypothetical protein ABB07_36475 [Streptomyces incarnatus]|uniref:Uncharacterized protein n=1 Tax=Streptomyces incarnatus TaxID=665007 RepID=A0ABM5TWA5_9ACTN|nr:hypothetical protein ABB07_36475 [Streptomyces incarnatus]
MRQRLGNGGGLVLPAVDPLEGGRVTVAGTDVEARARALLAGGAERGGGDALLTGLGDAIDSMGGAFTMHCTALVLTGVRVR